MAGGKGHLIGGFIFILILLHTISHYFYRPSLLDLVLYVAIGLMFAVWPDVDIKSIGQKFFYTVFFLVDLILIYLEEYKNPKIFLLPFINISLIFVSFFYSVKGFVTGKQYL